MRLVAEFAVGDLSLLARGPPRDHRYPRSISLRRAIEHIDEVPMPWQRLRPSARMQIELRKDVSAQSRQMDVDPVVPPVDQVRTKRMARGVGGLERRVERANIFSMKRVNEFLDVRPVDLDQIAREIGVLHQGPDPDLDFLRPLILRADHIADEFRALLENSWNRPAREIVGALRHDDGLQMPPEPAHRA